MADNLWMLTKRCWSIQPADRPPMSEVLKRLPKEPRNGSVVKTVLLSTLGGRATLAQELSGDDVQEAIDVIQEVRAKRAHSLSRPHSLSGILR